MRNTAKDTTETVRQGPGHKDFCEARKKYALPQGQESPAASSVCRAIGKVAVSGQAHILAAKMLGT